MKKSKRKVKRRIKWKAFFLLLIFLFLVIYFVYTVINLPINQVLIKGTNLIPDYEIMEQTGLKEYPKLFKYSKSTIKKKVEELDLVNQVKVKKSLFGKITIEVDEAKVLFYNRNNGTYVLSNGKEITEGNYTGIPFLVNSVQSSVFDRLIKELSKLSTDTLSLVSEMEYAPSMSGDITLDETRFIFRMNDGIIVYINLIHMDRLDMYKEFYSVKNKEEKYLYLDSDFNVRFSNE